MHLVLLLLWRYVAYRILCVISRRGEPMRSPALVRIKTRPCGPDVNEHGRAHTLVRPYGRVWGFFKEMVIPGWISGPHEPHNKKTIRPKPYG